MFRVKKISGSLARDFFLLLCHNKNCACVVPITNINSFNLHFNKSPINHPTVQVCDHRRWRGKLQQKPEWSYKARLKKIEFLLSCEWKKKAFKTGALFIHKRCLHYAPLAQVFSMQPYKIYRKFSFFWLAGY